MPTLPCDLGDGLVLRDAAPGDGEQLVDLNGRLHAEADADGPDAAIIEWTRDLLDLPHPTFRLTDTTVVEDTATGRIVSAVFAIPQTWTYAGAPLSVGRPELVSTEPEYRRRGLVRRQFEVHHERADAAGQHLQFITGIPWYYRQFGYDYALDLRPQPTLRRGRKPIEADPRWGLRPATADDVTFIAELDACVSTRRPLLRCRRDAPTWALELARRPWGNYGADVLVVEDREDADGDDATATRPVGYVVVQRPNWGGSRPVRAFELVPGVPWLGPVRSVLARLDADLRAAATAEAAPGTPAERLPPLGITFALEDGHPALRSAATRLVDGSRGASYGLFVRVADLAHLLRAITPVLETRVAASPAAGFTGTLAVDLYTEALDLVFSDGRLTTVTSRPPADPEAADAAMPRDAFVNLVLGNRTFAELQPFVADCQAHTDAGALFADVLFPALGLSTWFLG